MNNILAFRIAVGSTVPENTPQAALDFYIFVANKLLGEDFKLIDSGLKTVIPISNSEMQSDPTKVYRSITDYFESNHPNNLKCLLIDISGPHKGILRGQVLTHLSSAIRWTYDRTEGLRVIVLVDETPASEDVFLKGLEELFQTESLFIINNQGECFPKDAQIPDDFSLDYQSQLKTIRTDAPALLQRRLIRRLGHFMWHNSNGEHIWCHRYFYDGSKCIAEIVELMKKEIDYIQGSDKIEIGGIVVQAPYSPWLEEAVSVVCGRLSIEYLPFEEYVTGKKKGKGLKDVLFVVDLVNTGRTIADSYLRMGKKHPTIGIHLLSILSTKADKGTQNTRNINIKSQSPLTLRFLHKVSPMQMKPADCPMCRLDIPQSSTTDDDFDVLTTYDMWEMNDKAKYIPERDTPDNRKPFKIVPDYPKMLEDYGSWIAFKLERLLESQNLLHPDLVVVSPAQLFPRSFSLYLKDITKIDAFIQIPKDHINKLTGQNGSEEAFQKFLDSEKPKWATELKSFSQEKVLVVDEFHVSGGTLKGLERVLKILKKDILCYIPVVDFNPRLSSKYEITTLSLYEIQRSLESS